MVIPCITCPTTLQLNDFIFHEHTVQNSITSVCFKTEKEEKKVTSFPPFR